MEPDRGLNEDLEGTDSVAWLGKVATQSSNLNVRTEPESSGNVCGSMPSMSYVTVLDTAPENGFYLVQTDACDEDYEFVSARYIELASDCERDDSELPPEEDDDEVEEPPTDLDPIENLGEFIDQYLERVGQ
jgi:hypothetical protein